MAEQEKQEGDAGKEGANAAKKGAKGKILLVVGGLLTLLLLIGIPVAVISMQSGESAESAKELPHDAAEIEGDDQHAIVEAHSYTEEDLEDGEEALGAIFPMDTFVVNLSKGRFVRVQMQFEFVERDVPGRFYARVVPSRDAIITLLASKSADDLSTPEGIEALKVDVRSRINEVLRKELVKRVYFTQFVVQ